MIRKYFSILFLSFIIVGCGGGSTTTPITVELTMESSAETLFNITILTHFHGHQMLVSATQVAAGLVKNL